MGRGQGTSQAGSAPLLFGSRSKGQGPQSPWRGISAGRLRRLLSTLSYNADDPTHVMIDLRGRGDWGLVLASFHYQTPTAEKFAHLLAAVKDGKYGLLILTSEQPRQWDHNAAASGRAGWTKSEGASRLYETDPETAVARFNTHFQELEENRFAVSVGEASAVDLELLEQRLAQFEEQHLALG